MKKNDTSLSTFKVISLLLSYPEQYWIDEIKGLMACLVDENALSGSVLEKLVEFSNTIQETNLIDLQANYVALFDQTRTLSLHLFEHIHGESKDRGQAMVDLSAAYQEQGFIINTKELPDYLPLFLEFLSVIPLTEANLLLNDCIQIVERIAETLAKRGNQYTAVLNAILVLANRPAVDWKIKVQQYYDPTAAERMDKEWEEEEIQFLNQSCSTDASSTSSCGKTSQQVIDVSALQKAKKVNQKEDFHE